MSNPNVLPYGDRNAEIDEVLCARPVAPVSTGEAADYIDIGPLDMARLSAAGLERLMADAGLPYDNQMYTLFGT